MPASGAKLNLLHMARVILRAASIPSRALRPTFAQRTTSSALLVPGALALLLPGCNILLGMGPDPSAAGGAASAGGQAYAAITSEPAVALTYENWITFDRNIITAVDNVLARLRSGDNDVKALVGSLWSLESEPSTINSTCLFLTTIQPPFLIKANSFLRRISHPGHTQPTFLIPPDYSASGHCVGSYLPMAREDFRCYSGFQRNDTEQGPSARNASYRHASALCQQHYVDNSQVFSGIPRPNRGNTQE